MRSDNHARIYELSSKGILLLLRAPGLRSFFTWSSKVWLRHARLAKHLAETPYDTIVDGGASIGEFAGLAQLAKPGTPLICVEPHPPSAVALRKRGFHVVEAALWHARGRLNLVQPTDAVTSSTVVAEVGAERPSWEVEAIRLDQLPIPGNDILIKLDLQGAEMQALEGMGALWPRCKGLLLEVSYGERGTYESLRRLLDSKGYYEAATFNELEVGTRVAEADKLWLRRSDASL